MIILEFFKPGKNVNTKIVVFVVVEEKSYRSKFPLTYRRLCRVLGTIVDSPCRIRFRSRVALLVLGRNYLSCFLFSYLSLNFVISERNTNTIQVFKDSRRRFEVEGKN